MLSCVDVENHLSFYGEKITDFYCMCIFCSSTAVERAVQFSFTIQLYFRAPAFNTAKSLGMQ